MSCVSRQATDVRRVVGDVRVTVNFTLRQNGPGVVLGVRAVPGSGEGHMGCCLNSENACQLTFVIPRHLIVLSLGAVKG